MASLSDYTTFIQALNTVQLSGPVFHQIKKIPDGVHESSAVLSYINKNASERDFTGADNITWDIINQEKIAYSYYGGTALQKSPQEFLKAAILPRAYYTNDVAYYRTQLIQNNSKDRFVNYVSKCLDQAKEGMTTRLALDLFGNGTTDANGGTAGGGSSVVRPITGLQLALDADETPDNIYAGIQRGTGTSYFNNQALDITALSSMSLDDIMNLRRKCSHMGKSPDLLAVPELAFRHIWNLARAEFNRVPKNENAIDLGFTENIDFLGMAIIPEKFMSGTAAGGYLTTELKLAYMLNTKDAISYKIDPSEDMKLGPVLQPTDEHTFVQHLTYSCAFAVIDPRLCGVMFWAS